MDETPPLPDTSTPSKLLRATVAELHEHGHVKYTFYELGQPEATARKCVMGAMNWVQAGRAIMFSEELPEPARLVREAALTAIVDDLHLDPPDYATTGDWRWITVAEWNNEDDVTPEMIEAELTQVADLLEAEEADA